MKVYTKDSTIIMPTTSTPALSIKNLHKTYINGVTALQNVNLEIAQGDFFALLGANGAGKSTMINIICSLANKTSGEILIFGHNLDSHSGIAKSFIGLVPQEFNFNIFEPVREIIINQGGYYGIPRKHCTEQADILLKQLGLWEKRAVLAQDLSGGMKRRLMIARSMIHRPKLLILDEPTAGVDIQIRRSMWKYINKINEAGTTIILTTHYLEEAENFCRNIAILNQGSIIKNTSMKALLGHTQTEILILNLKQPLITKPQTELFIIEQKDPTTLEVTLDKNNKNHSLNTLFDFFSKQHIEILSMRNRSNRLEQLFVSLIRKDKT